jgi:hypothetical protein
MFGSRQQPNTRLRSGRHWAVWGSPRPCQALSDPGVAAAALGNMPKAALRSILPPAYCHRGCA